MKVSILITYYNRKNLLKKTLDSIIKSEYINDTEILIVDDASKDKHRIEELIYKYHKFNITLFIFEKKDKWWTLQIPAHNKLISMATGDIIIHQGAECYHSGDIIKDSINNVKDIISFPKYSKFNRCRLSFFKTLNKSCGKPIIAFLAMYNAS